MHEPRLAANKVPLKLTSLNFELMAGQDGGGMQGLGIGGQGIGGAPGSAGALGAPSGVAGGPPAWNPMNAGHDSFFLPAGKQLSLPRGAAEQRKGSARMQQWRVLDPRDNPHAQHHPHHPPR